MDPSRQLVGLTVHDEGEGKEERRMRKHRNRLIRRTEALTGSSSDIGVDGSTSDMLKSIGFDAAFLYRERSLGLEGGEATVATTGGKVCCYYH